MRKARRIDEKAYRQCGAALPLVLVMIAGLSLIMAAAYRSVSLSSGVMRDLQANMNASQSLFSAEQQTLFIFLTGQATPLGLYLGEPINTEEVVFDRFDFSTLQQDAVWFAGGGERRVNNPEGRVVVSYWDGSAFPSLARVTKETAEVIFEAIGLKRDDGAVLAARLADYQDKDNVRRFRGGERSDYRLAELNPPTNSPLRNFEELFSVLGVGDMLSHEQHIALRERLSFSPEYIELRKAFVDDDFDAVVDADRDGEITDSSRLNDETPSRRARFKMTAYTSAGAHVRVLEIYRSANGAGKPFRRYWISEEKNANAKIMSGEKWNGYTDVF